MPAFAKSGAPSPVPNAPPTPKELVDLRNELEARARELTQQRHQHSFAWAAGGDQTAWSAIEQIDGERNRLNAQIEALGQAITVAQRNAQEQRQRDKSSDRRAAFDRDLPRLQRLLVANIADAFDRLAHQANRHIAARELNYAEYYLVGAAGGVTRLGGTIAGRQDGPPPPGVEGIPRDCARSLVESPRYTEALSTLVWNDVPQDQHQAVRARRKAERDRHIDVLADELLASVELPPVPPALEQVAAALKARTDAQ